MIAYNFYTELQVVGKGINKKNSKYHKITIYFPIDLNYFLLVFLLKIKVSVSTNIGDNIKVPIQIP